MDENQFSGESHDRLQRTGDQMPSIADASSSQGVGTDIAATAQPEVLRERCRRELRWRLARADCFGSDLFTDPAWDILLLLFSEELWRGGMAAGEFDRLGLPLTTIERWLQALDQRGLIQAAGNNANGLARKVGLSKRTRDAMIRYFSARPSN